MNFSDLFSNGKPGGAEKRVWRRLDGAWRVGARACWCSPAAAEEDEPDEALSEGCSSAERRRDGGEEWWQLELSVRAKEGAMGLRTEGKRGQ
jgi:hypothetical protein